MALMGFNDSSYFDSHDDSDNFNNSDNSRTSEDYYI